MNHKFHLFVNENYRVEFARTTGFPIIDKPRDLHLQNFRELNPFEELRVSITLYTT